MIVITGAAGLIGSGVVRHLNDLDRGNLLLVDDLKQGEKWKNLVGKQFVDMVPKTKLFEQLKDREEEIDAVIHLGACSDTTEADADYLLENNFRFTVKLADWALSHDKRFIYASSAATYGDGTLGFSDDESAIERLKPLNMYAFSKQLVDLWMKREKAFDRAVGLKYFNVYGPNEYHKKHMASMVLKMMRKADSDGVIQLYKSNHPQFADGEQQRDFIYVKDAVKMTCAFLEPECREIGGLFNIGQGQASSWNTLAGALFQALGKEPRIEYIDMPKELSRQYQNYTCAEMQKIRSTLTPSVCKVTSIQDAVQEYVQDYLLPSARW